MFRNSVAVRMTFGLVMMTVTSIMIANLLGLIPNPNELRRQRKVSLCESLAVNCSLLAQRSDASGIAASLQLAADRNQDIASLALRRENGRIVFQSGDHEKYWQGPTTTDAGRSPHDQLSVSIMRKDQRWGQLEVVFDDRRVSWLPMLLQTHYLLGLLVFSAAINAVGIFIYLNRTLTYLDPSQAVPDRVRTALDTLAEGLVVLDSKQRIVLANQSFAQKVGRTPDELQGLPVSQFGWRNRDETQRHLPWQQTADKNEPSVGAKMALRTKQHGERVFLVNASPIKDETGSQRGILASFDDITALEEKKIALQRMLEELRDSREEIKLQNRELQILATHDSLTDCLNRRTFFEAFEKQWHASHHQNFTLGSAMLDIDLFKSINDSYGHAIGDEVLRKVSHALKAACGEDDILGRYGGEEFCLLLPGKSLDECAASAEQIRQQMKQLRFSISELRVAISIGISSTEHGSDPQEILEQADKALYAAKRGGRDQVKRWDQLPDDNAMDHEFRGPRIVARELPADDHAAPIPYPAVASLLSALSFRDPATAAHSIRVAETSVATARGLMSVRDAYILELAALLHDIGKIGVPDKILLKPGPLTAEEWQIMEVHDRIGVEIVESSFCHPQLVDIVKYHHAWYQKREAVPDMPYGDDVPIGARIVSIADAYDAMVSDRAYRKGRSQEEAFIELRRCAGVQFDPRLVERFIAVMEDYHGPDGLTVDSKQAALQLGLQIEQLASALDRQNTNEISVLAERLERTAAQNQVHEIQDLAAALREVAHDDPDLHQLISMTRDLLDLCRSAQRTHVRTTPESDRADQSRREVPGLALPTLAD